MNEINWMAIAAIIIPSVASVFGAWLQARAMRAAATPAQNQPNDSTSDSGKETNLKKSRISEILMVGSPVAGLAYSFWIPEPSGRLFFAVVVFNAMFLVLGLTTISSTWFVDHRMRQWTDAINKATKSYGGLLKDLNEHMDSLRESRQTFLEIGNLQRERMKRLEETAKRIERARKAPKRPPSD